MIALDTDILTLFLAGYPSVVERHRRVEDEVTITAVTRIEALQGRFAAVLKAPDGADALRAQERLERTEMGLAPFRILLFDSDAAAHFDRLRQDKRFNKIGRADLLIASIALAHRATLVTRNRRHFRPIPGLKLDDWTT
jgi:tRNA(fMet)-specific endonuclease VapC